MSDEAWTDKNLRMAGLAFGTLVAIVSLLVVPYNVRVWLVHREMATNGYEQRVVTIEVKSYEHHGPPKIYTKYEVLWVKTQEGK